MESAKFRQDFKKFCGARYDSFLAATNTRGKRGRLLAWQELLLEKFARTSGHPVVIDPIKIDALLREDLAEEAAARREREIARRRAEEKLRKLEEEEAARKAQEAALEDRKAAEKVLREELKKRIFICYAREDLDIAKRFHEDLTARGYHTWIDINDLLPGQPWREAIPTAIRKSGYFLALMSSRSVRKRGFLQREIRESLLVAQEMPPEEIFIIPVRLDDCVPPSTLVDKHWVDIFPSYEDGFKMILQSLHKPTSISLHKDPWYVEGFIGDRPWHTMIQKSPANIGRNADCEVVLPSRAVSGRHASIVVNGRVATLYDLGSTNGMTVNGRKVLGEHAIISGDIVTFADLKFRISTTPIIAHAFAETTSVRIGGGTDHHRESLIRELAEALGSSPEYQNHLVLQYRDFKESRDKALFLTADALVNASRRTHAVEMQAESDSQTGSLTEER